METSSVNTGNPDIDKFYNVASKDTGESSTSEATEFEDSLSGQQEPLESSEDVELPPAEQYRKRLDTLGISDDEAYSIIDDMCDKGSYMEKIVIRPARGAKQELNVVFITRDSDTQGSIMEYALGCDHKLQAIYDKEVGSLQMAASIISLKGLNYTPVASLENKEDIIPKLKERADLFGKFPAPLTVILLRKLSEFDLKVATAMSPGYEDFF